MGETFCFDPPWPLAPSITPHFPAPRIFSSHHRARHPRSPCPPPSSCIASSSFGSASKPRRKPLRPRLWRRPNGESRKLARHHHHTTPQEHTRRPEPPPPRQGPPLHVTPCVGLAGVVVVATVAGGGGGGAR